MNNVFRVGHNEKHQFWVGELAEIGWTGFASCRTNDTNFIPKVGLPQGKQDAISSLISAIYAPLSGLGVVENWAHCVCKHCGCSDSDCSNCVSRLGNPCSWLDENTCSSCAMTFDGCEKAEASLFRMYPKLKFRKRKIGAFWRLQLSLGHCLVEAGSHFEANSLVNGLKEFSGAP